MSRPALADENAEAAYLARFKGTWTGNGSVRLAPGTPHISVTCKLLGDEGAAEAELNGQCSGFLISSPVSAKLRYDARKKSYSGSWTTNQNIVGLSGRRQGKALSLTVSEPPPRRLTISVGQGLLEMARESGIIWRHV